MKSKKPTKMYMIRVTAEQHKALADIESADPPDRVVAEREDEA